ncbi:MAG: hypothetical protein PHS56_03075 [Eubacteriales bacterium]|nr:hypothetical protein [Eubacteriales bacterium]MDD3073402.1 hypothetical protein [Eubacteriales bacterium]MDD4078661.1 hypothetical protein [Eubacteriales bacterium]MDD4769195.1 hypothetical protein [Eubacteriales bacterium]
MQAIMETLFDAAYLVGVITVGIIMMKNAKGSRQTLLFGCMSVLLGSGDAFHLVPRAYALWTTGLKANAAALGVGKLITSITMTIFYLLLYHIWRQRYKISNRKGLTYAIYGLAIIRIALCLFPQNQWLSYNAPVSWGIYRNLPFALMGIIIISIFYSQAKAQQDRAFKYMWLAILLSFALYIPVVLWSDTLPIIGVLMIPKTLAYVWVVLMGYSEYKKGISS